MDTKEQFVWKGHSDIPLDAYRPCGCCTCRRGRRGAGYLQASDAAGNGVTIWIRNDAVFRMLQKALRRGRSTSTFNKPMQNIAPPKPDRIELLKQVRRATIEDQLHLLDWLEKKYAKIRPHETK